MKYFLLSLICFFKMTAFGDLKETVMLNGLTYTSENGKKKDSEELKNLILNIQRNNTTEVERIVKENKSLVNATTAVQGRTPLHFAAGTAGSDAIINLLIKNGADPLAFAGEGAAESHSKMPFTREIYNQKSKETFGEALATLHKGDTPLHFAAAFGNLNALKRLMEDSNVKAKYPNGDIPTGPFKLGISLKSRPLHWATLSGHKDVVEYLLSKGAPANSRTFHGDVPVHFAALANRVDILELLKKNGADLFAKNALGETGMLFGAQAGSLDAVKYFVANGADINATDNYDSSDVDADSKFKKFVARTLLWARAKAAVKNRTALMHAASAGQKEVMDYLETLPGINKELKDKDGKTAQDITKEAADDSSATSGK